MIVFFFAAVLFSASVRPQQQTVEPYRFFQEEYSVSVPLETDKQDPLFEQELKKKSVFYPFLLQSVRVEALEGKGDDEKKERSLAYIFSLLPRTAGTRFFSPGAIPFSGERQVVCPAAVVSVKPPLPWTVFQERLLPLHPDQALSLSQKNYGLSFQDMAERERLRSEKLYAQRESSLAAVSIFSLGLVTAALLFWVVFELELHKRTRGAPAPKVNWEQELRRLLKSDSIPFRVRLHLLSQIIPHVGVIDRVAASAVLEEVEEMRFSGIELDQERQVKFWKKIAASLSVLLPQ